jgi:tetratricopeptide (TPR) repeat protein
VQKYIQRGQVDKAIKTLENIISIDPNDASIQIKVGDLYSRKGKIKSAKEAYFKAANIYLKEGYNSRAIATYKMVARVDPEDIEVCKSIAELFEKQGLVGDALQQYKYAATIHDQHKEYSEMSKVLKKILELDPGNLAAMVKTAEVCFINKKEDEAHKILSEISKDLKQKKLYSDYLKAFELFLDKAPKDKYILKEIASAHILLGNPGEGLKKIQDAQKLDPKDSETSLILAETYLLLDKTNDAESIYCDILRKNEKDYRAKFGLSKIFLKKDNIEEAVKGIDPFYNEFEENGELNKLGTFYEQALEKAPSDIHILEKLSEIYRYFNNKPKLVNMYERLAEVYKSNNETDKATFLYKKVIQINPNHEKAKDFLSKTGEGLPAEAAGGQAGAITEEAINEHITEADVYLKYGLYDQAQEHIDIILKNNPNHIEALTVLKDIYIANNQKGLAVSELFKLSEISAENKLNFLSEIVKIDPENAEANEKLKGLGIAPAEEKPVPKAVPEEEPIEAEVLEDIDLIVEEPEEVKEEEKEKEEKIKKLKKKVGKTLQEELEEAEFYFAEGLFDDAKVVYKRILLDDPYNMLAVERLEQIEQEVSVAKEVDVVPAKAKEGEKFFDLAKELEESLPDDLLKPPGTQQEKGAAEDTELETKDIFSKFKKGIDEHIDSKDYDSHYNLGIAYKEMGLFTDSAEEFKKALYADSTKLKMLFYTLRKYFQKLRCLLSRLTSLDMNWQPLIMETVNVKKLWKT